MDVGLHVTREDHRTFLIFTDNDWQKRDTKGDDVLF